MAGFILAVLVVSAGILIAEYLWLKRENDDD